ncbi:MAG: antitoxin VapB family protein [Sulfolobaceae archaeon]|nr:antitoxin VapB family protein [Sulfolobaceae archaeon]
MAKTITISDKAYESLLREKREGESFSDVILRLINERKSKSPINYAGIWGDLSDKQVQALFEELREKWSKWAVNA